MRYVSLPAPSRTPSDPQLSVLGFGCGALLGRAGRKESLAALSGAADAGITFFDTARSYGYGASESLLGEFLTGRRQQAVLCTKFGIVPTPRTGWKQRIKPLAQAIVKAVPALRSLARRQASGQIAAGQFSLEVLQTSLETSLRALKTDYVDMLLLHAAPASVLHQADLLEALARLVEQGKVRMAGISGEHETIVATFEARPPALTTAQFVLNRTNLAFAAVARPAAQHFFLVGNHPFGGPDGVAATLARIAALRASPGLPATLRDKLDPADPALMPDVLLNLILHETGISAVVPAMMRPANLRLNAAAIANSRFTQEELTQLRQTLIQTP